jgi:hypothetical protein
LRAPQPQLDLDGLLCGTRCVAASDNLCSEPPSSSLQHLSSSNYGFLGSTTYSSLGSNETVQAASVVLGFLRSGGGCAHNYLGMQPCSYSAASRQHLLLRHPREKRWRIPKQRLFTHTLTHSHPLACFRQSAPARPPLRSCVHQSGPARPPPPPAPPARAQQFSGPPAAAL